MESKSAFLVVIQSPEKDAEWDPTDAPEVWHLIYTAGLVSWHRLHEIIDEKADNKNEEVKSTPLEMNQRAESSRIGLNEN